MTFSDCKILVVDDTKDVRTTVAGGLNDAGFLVQTSANKLDAIKILQSEIFQFAVIDVNLLGFGDESGLELVKQIHDQNIKSQIILITGQEVKASHFNVAIQYGVIGYLKKAGNWVNAVHNIIKKNYSQFDVFLCHNGDDKLAVKTIGEALKKKGVRPWLDEWELQPGLPWQQIIEAQIENIKSAAVFVGESGLGPWQKMEIRGLLSEFVNRSIPVIPVLLNNAPKRPILPLFLREMTWVDFRKKDPNPMERLLWGVTGKKPK